MAKLFYVFVMIIIDVKAEQLVYYNPMQVGGPTAAERVRLTTQFLGYLTRRYDHEDGCKINFKKFKVVSCKLPNEQQQNNGFDCGVFVLGKASSIFNTGRSDVKIFQSDCRDIRLAMGGLLMKHHDPIWREKMSTHRGMIDENQSTICALCVHFKNKTVF